MGERRKSQKRNRLSQCVIKPTKTFAFADSFLFRIHRNGIMHKKQGQITQIVGLILVKTTVFNILELFFFFFA